jgi:hypothetical protein
MQGLLAFPADKGPPPAISNNTFRALFCQKSVYPPEKFKSKLFWRSLYPMAAPLAVLIVFFNPRFFELDYTLIDEVGEMKDMADLQPAIDTYLDCCWLSRSYLHDRLRIRISTRRLRALVQEIRQPSNPVVPGA